MITPITNSWVSISVSSAIANSDWRKISEVTKSIVIYVLKRELQRVNSAGRGIFAEQVLACQVNSYRLTPTRGPSSGLISPAIEYGVYGGVLLWRGGGSPRGV